MRGGLTGRTFLATATLTVIVGVSFALLLLAVVDLRDSVHRSERAQEVLVVANHIERLLVDVETGERGFLLTHDARFLQPWQAARRALPEEEAQLRSLVNDDPEQEGRVDGLIRSITSYIVDYSVPLVNAAAAGTPPPHLDETLREGKRRVDAIRRQFDAFIAAQTALVSGREERADSQARRAVFATIFGLTASLVLVLLFTAYLRRGVVRPLLRAAGMARRLSEGDLSARMSETSAGEIGELERAFNGMATSLAESRDRLQRLADEQTSLRRVATLVARGRPSAEIFAAVAEETSVVLGADHSAIVRLEPDGMSTVLVGSYGGDAAETPVGIPGPVDPRTPIGSVLSTGRSARMDDDDATSRSKLGGVDAARRPDVASAVASPIVVEGRLWGAIGIASRERHFPPDTEQRMVEFTELLATAVANAQSRGELIASRARIVAASDEARRKIERDLHDGAQQRLVSLGLELREIESTLPVELSELRAQVARVGGALEEVLENLREISRGIHPAILAQGGLVPALKALARRSTLAVDLHADLHGRLPESVEAAAYYLVSEALTNAVRHAGANVVEVGAVVRDGWLELSVRDDGVGGADPTRGSGLVGLRDRAAAIGGTLEITSPPGRGTTLTARLPVSAD